MDGGASVSSALLLLHPEETQVLFTSETEVLNVKIRIKTGVKNQTSVFLMREGLNCS